MSNITFENNLRIDNMSEKLKACPFCGDSGILYLQKETNEYFVTCGNESCALLVFTALHKNMDDAINEWNNRK